jgi:two-component system response regulator YesN
MIRVLIVDDDRLVRRGLTFTLPWDRFGMRVVGEASNGVIAMEFLKTNPVDLVLIDIEMPVMNGIELLRAIRSEYSHIYAVVLTLHENFKYVQEALRLGAIDYISKLQLETENFEEILKNIHARIIKENISHSSRNQAYENFHSETVSTEEFSRLKEQWLSFQWIFDDMLFKSLLTSLKQSRLSEGRTVHLMYDIALEWNKKFNAMSEYKINVPDTFSGWTEVGDWLANIYDLTSSITRKYQYKQEIIDSITKAVKIITEEMDREIYANDVAKRVNVSRSYFFQAFKEVMGKSFNDYLKFVRIEKAKELLVVSDKPIQLISNMIGYLDQKYFSQVFREQTGMLPKEYRNRYKKRR